MKNKIWEERFRKAQRKVLELETQLAYAKKEILAYHKENEHYRKVIKDAGLVDVADSLETEETKDEQRTDNQPNIVAESSPVSGTTETESSTAA